jgi:hypothetical protein
MIYNLRFDDVLTDKLRELETPPDVSHKNMYWLPFIDERNPVYDPETHKLSPLERLVEGGNSVWRRTPVALTAQELADKQTADDNGYISETASQKAMWILVELVSELVANGTIQPTDFTPDVRQTFQDLEARVNRVKP